MSETAERTALILGATGAVGRVLLDMALSHQEFAGVTVLARRPTGMVHPLLHERVVDFDRLAEAADAFRVTDLFCALGTTLAAAGSRAAFRQVDHDYVVTAARAARAGGVRRFLLVSSVGASPSAGSFYLRVKGETEAAVAKLRFQALHVFRPGLLLAERTERRPAERLGTAVMPLINPLLLGGLRKYRAIPPATVAAAMIGAALSGDRGTYIHHHDDILRLTAAF